MLGSHAERWAVLGPPPTTTPSTQGARTVRPARCSAGESGHGLSVMALRARSEPATQTEARL